MVANEQGKTQGTSDGDAAGTPGFITPPPHLIPPHLNPPRHDTQTETQRAPARKRELPVFLPPTGRPVVDLPAPQETTAQEATAQEVTVQAVAPGAGAAEQARPDAVRWALELPGGVSVPVDGALLLGRNPVRFASWSAATLLPVDDPTRSVSKTHAVIEAAGEQLIVTDLHSTNGTVVAAADGEHELEPTVPYPVGADTVMWLGRFELRLTRG